MAVRVDAEGDYVERDCEENSFRFHEIVALDDDTMLRWLIMLEDLYACRVVNVWNSLPDILYCRYC